LESWVIITHNSNKDFNKIELQFYFAITTFLITSVLYVLILKKYTPVLKLSKRMTSSLTFGFSKLTLLPTLSNISSFLIIKDELIFKWFLAGFGYRVISIEPLFSIFIELVSSITFFLVLE